MVGVKYINISLVYVGVNMDLNKFYERSIRWWCFNMYIKLSLVFILVK